MRLAPIDIAVLLAYVGFVLGIGYWLKDRMKTSEDFLLAGRSMPSWVTGLAFMAANLGSLEIVGMIAMGAKYGMMTNHWYWTGAIPPMVFLSLFMVRFYYVSKVRSVPEYLKRRFDHRSHMLNSGTFLIVTVLMSGINMYALAIVCEQMLGWSFSFSVLFSAGVVVTYTFLGGLSSSIYNEVLQFFLIVFGFVPLAVLGLIDVGGWDALTAKLPASHAHTWIGMGSTATNPLGVEWYMPVLALMLLMGPSYWCTDFLLVQRALAAKDLDAAQKTPLIAAFPKMLFPFLVTLPGMIASVVVPKALDGNFNLALPALMNRYYPHGLLGLGFTALMASFMSGMAGNVTAFNTVWTYDLYQTYMAPGRADHHYLKVGRMATVVGTALSVGAAYILLAFDNLMDYMQLLGAMFIAPFFIVFFLGMFSKRTTAAGSFWGILAGLGGCIAQYTLYRVGYIHYASPMGATLNLAVWGGAAGLLTAVIVSLLTKPVPEEKLHGLVYGLTDREPESQGPRAWYRTPLFLAGMVMALYAVLNVVFR
ncbi:MAG TPA: sodium:solute symporter family protein [Bryobacteraceae bacterium]|nr:sodium:solute symporter family protein [Bryobacteraceae bacterium]